MIIISYKLLRTSKYMNDNQKINYWIIKLTL